MALGPGLLNGINVAPRNVNEALKALNEASRRMRSAGDFRAIFPDIYGIITREVAHEINHDTGFFQEPQFISRLAGCFSERYFETLRWSLEQETQDCTAWNVAYGYGVKGATIPFQDAILGISAHINFDLAQGLFHTIREHAVGPGHPLLRRYKHDHDAVNAILERALPESFERLMHIYSCRASRLLWYRLRWATNRLTLRTLQIWREQVWDDVIRLLEAKGETGRAPILVEMEQRSGRMGRVFCAFNEAVVRGRPLARWMMSLPPSRGLDLMWVRQKA